MVCQIERRCSLLKIVLYLHILEKLILNKFRVEYVFEMKCSRLSINVAAISYRSNHIRNQQWKHT